MSALAKNYNRRKISFKRGKGSFLYSTNGKKYLDFVQGIAVNSLGHANPYLTKMMNKQAKKVWHVSNAFLIPEGEKLARRLKQKTFADYVIFQNSGAEATEVAVKVARRYFYSKGKPEKNRILCIKNSFHGRTLAAIFASGSKKMTEGFGPKVPGFDHFDFADHKGLEKAITSRTAAIMVETIMGEGGIKVIPDYCLVGLRKLCNKKKILLILDEATSAVDKETDDLIQKSLKIINKEETKKRMKEVLTKIQSGDFTREWMNECKNGQKNFLQTRAKLAEHPIEKVGADLRAMMPWITKKKLVDSDKN